MRWEELRRSIVVFLRNSAELQQLLSLAENSIEVGLELVQNVRSPKFRDNYSAQLDQRIHNLLASAVTLVDHTRRWLKNYPDTEFEKGFNRRSQVIKESPVANFLRRLRNYLLHYGMAPFWYRVTISENSNGSYILLDCAYLLRWDGWNPSSRAYIEGAGEGIQFSAAVNDYLAKMTGLYRWVERQFDLMHAQEITDANSIVDQINLIIFGDAEMGNGPS